MGQLRHIPWVLDHLLPLQFDGAAAHLVLVWEGDSQADYVHGGVGWINGEEGEDAEKEGWRERVSCRLCLLLCAPPYALA